MKIADKINDAIRRIEECGWTQGAYRNSLGQFCLVDSLIDGDDDTRHFIPVRRVIQLAINAESLIHWNDEPGRTKDQVLAVMRVAASLPEAQRAL